MWEWEALSLYLDAKQPDADIDAAQSVNKLQKQEIGQKCENIINCFLSLLIMLRMILMLVLMIQVPHTYVQPRKLVSFSSLVIYLYNNDADAGTDGIMMLKRMILTIHAVL